MFVFVTNVIHNYIGQGAMWLLYLAALVYVLLTDRNWKHKLFLGIVPLCILIVFLIPAFQIAFNHFLDPDTYYRVLWILPMNVTIAYAGVQLYRQYRIVALVGIVAAIFLCGSDVYKSGHFSKAENPYHIPQTVVDICDEILPENGNPVCAAFPDELIHFVRQYSSKIIMPYGRELIVTQWGYYTPFYNLMHEGVMETGELSFTAKGFSCNYLIMKKEQEYQEPLEDYGYIMVKEIDGYYIWKDTTVTWPD